MPKQKKPITPVPSSLSRIQTDHVLTTKNKIAYFLTTPTLKQVPASKAALMFSLFQRHPFRSLVSKHHFI
jgi:hypothetical protein